MVLEKITNHIFLDMNYVYKRFMTNISWGVYVATFILILFSCAYYYRYYKRGQDLQRRRREVQRSNERAPQRRRPGATSRDHEIFRNVMTTVHGYMDTEGPEEQHGQTEWSQEYLQPITYGQTRNTRSGHVYGYYE